ncbi:MAG: bifunctional phosphoribosyl-AMP cyclohydrolase/phosphoribosyl-ATP diphosphatase HisIE [Wenzhouxiangella sp.]|jgi:phosphoribosyl-ATP pyrophosphohydrolase/phosphoribosyl-AMP cyclohydrolase|nr:bifunctional phosphoribosyl-AMP cyclohydrolase/phosphoribosyl-ATP diphosphatase HisIE [Wenzhouxiangella sp.]
MLTENDIDRLDFTKGDGLIPAIIQDARDGRVLMLGYMNAEALARTIEARRVTFFSRSKQRLWTKGESSGHHLELVDMAADCDRDTLLVQAIPHGPTCHTGTETCFGETNWPPVGLLARLQTLIEDRRSGDPEKSYTTRLLQGDLARCAQKVGEEGVETALAAVTANKLDEEAADLLYHLLVCLTAADSSLDQVLAELQRRRG